MATSDQSPVFYLRQSAPQMASVPPACPRAYAFSSRPSLFVVLHDEATSPSRDRLWPRGAPRVAGRQEQVRPGFWALRAAEPVAPAEPETSCALAGPASDDAVWAPGRTATR